MSLESIDRKKWKSPVGILCLDAVEDQLVAIHFPGQVEPPKRSSSHPVLERAVEQLHEYFTGARKKFDLPLDPRGTPFQKKVWLQLRKIPWGTTISYGELAKRIGQPTASRAVGAANGKNPLSIVVPCHRVIGANGNLTGFGGGLPTKERLLRLEGVLPPDLFSTQIGARG